MIRLSQELVSLIHARAPAATAGMRLLARGARRGVEVHPVLLPIDAAAVRPVRVHRGVQLLGRASAPRDIAGTDVRLPRTALRYERDGLHASTRTEPSQRRSGEVSVCQAVR